MTSEIETHPVQTNCKHKYGGATMPKVVCLRAYEVYKHIHGPQEALIDKEGRGCRGGFGVGELIAFLYAYGFPKNEWRDRANEAFKGMDL